MHAHGLIKTKIVCQIFRGKLLNLSWGTFVALLADWQSGPQRDPRRVSLRVCGQSHFFDKESVHPRNSRRTLVKSIRRRAKQEFARASFKAVRHRCLGRNTRGFLYGFRAFRSMFACSANCRLFVDRRQCLGRFWSDFNGNTDWNRPGSNRRRLAEREHRGDEHGLEQQPVYKNE